MSCWLRETSIDGNPPAASTCAATDVELEVFVHGALCMSYSGQCGASFAMGGRSSNRGECAQACRLPYELVCDDETIDLEDRKFLMSPKDLASYDLLPELLAAGVDVLKIEGRLKSPEYVAAATQQYRAAISEAMEGRRVQLASKQLIQLESPFSRGFSHGWLEGPGRNLLNAATSAKRGVPIGTVVSFGNERVEIELNEPIRRGDGVAFEAGDGESAQGGRVYEIFVGHVSLTSRKPLPVASSWPLVGATSTSTACTLANRFGKRTIRWSNASCARRSTVPMPIAACRLI